MARFPAPEELAAACARVEQAFGGLELLVNAAGVGYRARVEALEPAPLRALFALNVEALLLACRHALPLLEPGRAPVVVNVSSVVGRRGIPGQVAYAATKAAVNSIGEGLRVEWAERGVAICTLEPGLTRTGFFDAQPNPHALPHPPLAAADEPERVARAVLDLATRPRPVHCLRWKWRLGALPRTSRPARRA